MQKAAYKLVNSLLTERERERERERENKIKINGRWDIAAKFIFSFCFIKEMIFALFPLSIRFVHLLYLQVSCAKKYSKECPKFTVRSDYRNPSRLSNMVSKPKKFKAQPHHVICTKVAPGCSMNSRIQDSFKNMRHKGTHIFWPAHI
jgi:hypothetical protein